MGPAPEERFVLELEIDCNGRQSSYGLSHGGVKIHSWRVTKEGP